MKSGLLFPKNQKAKRHLKKHAGSIMQKKDGRCWMCVKIHGDNRIHPVLHKHHIFFGAGQRKISEREGFYAWLCPDCHILGAHAVHRDYAVCRKLQQAAQRRYEIDHTREEFIKLMGRSYL